MLSWRVLCRDVGMSVFITVAIVLPLWQLQPIYQEPDTQALSDRMLTESMRNLFREFLPTQTAKIIDGAEIPTIGHDGIIRWTNIARASGNPRLPPLNASPILDAIAGKRLSDMQAEHYFGHVSPGKYGAENMSAYFRYRYLLFGENIAAGGFADDQALVQAWMKSKAHRINILYPRYHEIGVAVGIVNFAGGSRWVAVQLFGLAVADCPHVDASLPDIITSERVHELQMEHAATALSAIIRHHRQKTVEDIADYNDTVRAYNDLFEKIQYRVQLINDLTNTYNAQIKAFNTCA